MRTSSRFFFSVAFLVVCACGFEFVRAGDSDIVITEILYNADPLNEGGEFVELHNRGSTTVDLRGWVLTDAIDYTFPNGVILRPGDYLVVARNADTAEAFYGVSVQGQYLGDLSNSDDVIVLKDDSLPRIVIDVVGYTDETPWPLEADGLGSSLELTDPAADNAFPESWWAGDLYSPGQPNQPLPPGTTEEVNDVVISEILYRPRRQEQRRDFDRTVAVAGPYMEEGDDRLGEYVEIHNRGVEPVNLSGWRFSDGVGFTFPENAIINPGDYLAICADPDAMRQRFDITNFIGPFESGTLSDGGERLTLRDANDDIIDTFIYNDRPPWPVAADEYGVSLEVIDVDSDNSTAANWAVSEAAFPALRPVVTGPGTWQPGFFMGVAPSASLYFHVDGIGEWLIDDIVVYHGSGPSVGSTQAHYRFEENSGVAISNSVTGNIEGVLVTAGFSSDTPGATSANVENQYSADFTSGGWGRIDGRPFPLHDASGDRTVEWYMKMPQTDGHNGLLWTNDDDSSDENRFNIFWGASFTDIPNTVSGDFRGPGGVGPFPISTHTGAPTLPIGEWFHVAIVRTEVGDGSMSWQWYFDGDERPQQAAVTGSDAVLPTAGSWLLAGRQGLAGTRTLMDELRLTSRALEPEEFLSSATALQAEAGVPPVFTESFEAGDADWSRLGNHVNSEPTSDEAWEGSASERLVSLGDGSPSSDALVISSTSGIIPGQEYTVFFRARYLSGTPSLTAGFSSGGPKVTVIPKNFGIPKPPVSGAVGTGTPGRVNSVADVGVPPLIDNVGHLIQIPSSLESNTVNALVTSDADLNLVRLVYSTNLNSAVSSLIMYDDGLHLDGAAGDRVYATTIPARPSGTVVHYWVEAFARDGLSSISPREGDPSPTRAYYHYDNDVDTGLTFFDLFISNSELSKLTSNIWGREYVDCTLVIDGIAYPHIGARLRGRHTSRGHPKRQFKFRFNKPDFYRGQRALDTQLQIPYTQKMAYEVFDRSGITNLSSDLIRLHRNGSFFGVYVAFDSPSSSWLNSRGLDPRGEVYKARTIETPGQSKNTDLYANQLETDLDFSQAWNKKMRSLEPPDHIRALTDGLNQLSGDARLAWMDRNIDLDQWLQRWALYVLMNIDDFTGHNHFMFLPGEEGSKWQQLAFDFDSGWNHRRVGPMRILYGDGKNGDSPQWQRGRFYDLVANNATLRRIYYFKMQEVLEDFYHSATLFPLMDELFERSAPERVLDIGRWGSTMRSSTNEMKEVFNKQRVSMVSFIASQRLPTVSITSNPPPGSFLGTTPILLQAPGGWTVAFTTDGSDPRLSDTRTIYSGSPIDLIEPTLIRAAAYRGVVFGGDWSRVSELSFDVSVEEQGPFLRGDCNGDRKVDAITDALYFLYYSFLRSTFPTCLAACDVNSNGVLDGDVGDALYLLMYGYRAGQAPPEPFPDCGTTFEETDATLGCAFSSCSL